MEDKGIIKRDAKADSWKPLTYLVEAGSKTKPKELNMPEIVLKSVLPNRANNNVLNEWKVKENEQNGNKSRMNGDEKDSTPPQIRRKVQDVQQTMEYSSIAAPTVVDTDSTKGGNIFRPAWFSLIASSDR